VRWCRCGRRAISTIIAGIIVLTLLLTALSTMMFITQQYDAYQSILNTMSQKDTDRFSENIAAVYPGIFPTNQSVTCGALSCKQYTLALSNVGPIEVQIARIYINSTNSTVCQKVCVLDPSSTTAPYKFQASESLIDSGDSLHFLTFWLIATLPLPVIPDANSIGLVTSRGRVFTFQWTIPQGVAIPSELRLDMGPLRIIYDPNLIAFTVIGGVPGQNRCANNYPSATPCYQAGWSRSFPPGPVVFYVRISNIGNATVTLLDKSYLLADGVPASGGQPNPVQFYIVPPMPSSCHDTYFDSSTYINTINNSPTCPTPSSIPSYPGYNATYTSYGNCNWQNPCYQLPNATDQVGVAGQQTYVLFSAQTANGIIASSLLPSYNYFLYLELSYAYLGYEYSTSLPLIVIST
jgi:hypothetical protein